MFGIRGKLLVFAALVWLVIFGLYGTYVYLEKIDRMKEYGVNTASILSEQILAEREHYASTVIEGAIVAGLRVGGMGAKGFEGVKSSIPPHVTFIRKPGEGREGGEDYFVNIVSDNPLNMEKVPRDPFEVAGLKVLSSGREKSYVNFQKYAGRFSVRYMVPDFATTSSCAGCHNSHPLSKRTDYRLGDMMGALEVIIPIEEARRGVMSDIQRSIGYGFVVILVMGMAGLAFLSRVVSNPIQRLAETTRQLATGDLTSVAGIDSSDELGELGRGTDEVIANLNDMIEGIRSTSDEAVEIAATVREKSRLVVEGSHTQASSLDTITSGMENINTSIAEIAKSTEALAGSTESGLASVSESGASIKEVAMDMETLVTNVDDMADSAGKISISIKEVSENIASLSEALAQVSTSVVDINESIKGVDMNTSETAGITGELIEDARSGLASVERTIEGIERTREITALSTDTIKVLSERVMEIGKIVDVIRNVSEETNLLALNAAIIATKAGESGKSFSVVAGEITELAESTSDSTKEIAGLIKSVQSESLRAVELMEKGLVSATEGETLGKEAGTALAKIVEGTEMSNERISDIAAAAAHQSTTSRLVVEATGKVASTAERISNATVKLASSGELISRTAERIREVSLSSRGSTVEQVEVNKKIAAAMEDVSRMVAQINQAIQEQSHGSARILHSIEDVREVSFKNIEKARESEEAVEALARLNKALIGSVSWFKLKRRTR